MYKSATCSELQILLDSADQLRHWGGVCGLPVHPKSLPCCTVPVTDSLVEWSVGLCKGEEKGKEPRWKTACHILQKWLIVQKESHLQQMNIETHKSEINKMLWLEYYFLFSGFLLFLQSLTLPIPCDSPFTFLLCQHMVILYHFCVLHGCPIFIFFLSFYIFCLWFVLFYLVTFW